jgi:hypothetical protein
LFVFLVIPAQKELEANRHGTRPAGTRLTTAKSRYGSITTTEAGVARSFRASMILKPDFAERDQRQNGDLPALQRLDFRLRLERTRPDRITRRSK